MEGKGGEVRRVHIIYFLSRMGQVEHPHLIRVHHLGRRGVHLRDVKRWLSELRGKDMPDSFAWSFKRRYKNGYVWQDLMDDDLISPISDNEYVLKGSEISSPTITFGTDHHYSCVDQKRGSSTDDPKPNPVLVESKHPQEAAQTTEEYSTPFDSETSTISTTDDSIKTSSPTASSTTTDQSDQQIKKKTTEIEEFGGEEVVEDIDHFKEYWKNNNINGVDEDLEEKDEVKQARASRSSSFSKNKSKSYTGGGSISVFRNLLSCRAVDTNDSIVTSINKTSSNSKSNNGTEMCWRVDKHKMGGSHRIFSGPCNPIYDTRKSFKKSKEKKVSAAYKTVAEPNCSQCGKAFKPEKLHTHMKSCRGLKSFRKSRNATTEMQMAQTEALSKEGNLELTL